MLQLNAGGNADDAFVGPGPQKTCHGSFLNLPRYRPEVVFAAVVFAATPHKATLSLLGLLAQATGRRPMCSVRTVKMLEICSCAVEASLAMSDVLANLVAQAVPGRGSDKAR